MPVEGMAAQACANVMEMRDEFMLTGPIYDWERDVVEGRATATRGPTKY